MLVGINVFRAPPWKFLKEGRYGEVSASTFKSSAIKITADIFSSSLDEDRYDEEMNDHDGVEEADDDEHLREWLGDIKQIT